MLGLHRTAERDVAMSPYYFYVVAIIDREKFLTTARRILRVNSRLVAFDWLPAGISGFLWTASIMQKRLVASYFCERLSIRVLRS